MERSLGHSLDVKRTSDVCLAYSAPFNNWLLKKPVKQGLESAGYKMPTVIQASAIPVGKIGHDLLIQSKAGTGKTLIFCTILLENCLDYPGLTSIIVAPTREIAIQIEEVLRRISRHCKNFDIVCAIGGTDIAIERQQLQTANAVVATPGRLVHLLESDFFRACNIRLLILDEADKLFGTSHRKNIETILRFVPSGRQILACSATFCNNLDVELAKVMRNPIWISTKDKMASLVGIKQYVYKLEDKKPALLEMEAKIDALLDIFKRIPFKLCMVFSQSQSRAETYQSYLKKAGWECDYISGALKQDKRNEIFKKFCGFHTRVLVSTDLMARGIDSEHVNLVINLEPPYDMVTYLHRVGRAGRFGSYGIAVNILSTNSDYERFEKIMSEVGGGLKIHEFPNSSDDREADDIWDPKTFRESFSDPGSPILREHEKNNNVKTQPQSDIKILCSNEDSHLSINTNTFCVDSKDSAVNILHSPVLDNKENFLLCQPEDTPTSNRSSMQLSANTIDDASSIAVDSQLSTHQDLLAPCPSLAMEIKDKCAIFETDTTKTMPEHKHNEQQNLNLNLRNVSIVEQFSFPKVIVKPQNDDVFALYTDYLENGDIESNADAQNEMGGSYEATTIAEDFSNEKQGTSMQVFVDSTKETETFENMPTDQHAGAGNSLTESQTNLDQTNGSGFESRIISESSLEEHKASLARFFNSKLPNAPSALNKSAQSENFEINSETIVANEDFETEDTAENKDANHDDKVKEMWINEYWKQVNFIQAYTKFALDYSKNSKLN